MSFNPLCSYTLIIIFASFALFMFFMMSMWVIPAIFLLIAVFLFYLKRSVFCDPTKVVDKLSNIF